LKEAVTTAFSFVDAPDRIQTPEKAARTTGNLYVFRIFIHSNLF